MARGALVVVLLGLAALCQTESCWAASAVKSASPPPEVAPPAEREHWAFRKIQPASIPTSRQTVGTSPIDSFLIVRLEKAGLRFSPPADEATLLRRAFLDLHGLPPMPDDVAEFIADAKPDAFARLINRLLASPRFGERWGRHWLDVVGYADTVGFDSDANGIIISDGKWKYRDYVIESFNSDKPYDRFLLEQIAGDELVDWRNAPHFTKEIRDCLIATGYLRTARDQTHEPESNIPLNYYGVLHDTVEMLGSSLFAVTLNCARCHSHKFDPIPQHDYYRVMALLTPAYDPAHWKPVFPWKPEIKDRGIPDVSAAQKEAIDRENVALDREIADLRRKVSEPTCSADLKQSLKRRIAQRSGDRHPVGHIQALYDVTAAPVTHLLVRGQYETPGEIVEPGFLRVLCDSDEAAVVGRQEASDAESRRRTAFARWLTRKNSRAAALVARVMVNRIWQHLFGEGLVRTPENFGVQGESPTHPELLEWLAADFINSGWRIKPLVRKIVLSAAYRQSSKTTFAKPPAPDPENRLLWRMRPKRLDAEVIRDCLLAVSGRLDSTMGGPPVLLVAQPDGMVVVDASKLKRAADANKRSVYLLSRRAYNLSLLTVFDQPIFAVNCPKRDASVIPLQSLTMSNDTLVVTLSEQFAARLIAPPSVAPGDRVRRAFAASLAREPNEFERRTCVSFLDRQEAAFRRAGASEAEAHQRSLAALCHTLLNTSEFVYAE
jgi:hypothetical protein